MTSLRTSAFFTLLLAGTAGASMAAGCGDSGENGGDGDGDGIGGAGDGDSGSGDGDVGDGDGLGGAGNLVPATCNSDKDCAADEKLCDTLRRVCVECLANTDCGEDALCKSSGCVAITPCQSSKECPTDQVCSPTLSYCVECEGDNDCGEERACVANECRATCGSDKDCKQNDEVCNLNAGVCVACNADPDCGDGNYCAESNECMPQVCEPGDSVCADGELSTCTLRGDGFSATPCEGGCNEAGTACENTECTVGDAGCDCYPNETCNDDLECAGGTCVNPGSCLGVTNALCSTVAKFTGTQTLDGSAEDFCNVPATVVTFASAEFTDVENGSADTSISQATVKVAWDETALRAHVHVVDPALLHGGGASYNGDNVQFFISSNAPNSGLTDTPTPGVTQVTIVPAAGGTPSLIEYWGDSPSLLPATTPSYFTDEVSDGYVVEMLWPWRETPPTSGEQIGFNLMVGVDDSGLGRDFEYAYALEPVVENNCILTYSADPSPWCEQRHWCAPTLSP